MTGDDVFVVADGGVGYSEGGNEAARRLSVGGFYGVGEPTGDDQLPCADRVPQSGS